jgi:AcrR family transcriptional regulator
MPRPSRHLDRALLAAGRELLPLHGCSGLTIRQVADAAGVNIGMFHYHFRTREAFLRALLQQAYEEMFSRLTPVAAGRGASWTANLRSALRVVGRFVLANRALLARVIADAVAGNRVAGDFLRENFPRHLRVIVGLVAGGQAAGELREMAPLQAFAFCAGAMGMALLVGGAIADGDAADPALRRELADTVLTEAALDERVELALVALAAPARRLERKGGDR